MGAWETKQKKNQVEQIEASIRNIWRIWKYFWENFYMEISIINGDQMPLHHNESHAQITMSFTSQDVFVRGNYTLSRKRVAAFTQLT